MFYQNIKHIEYIESNVQNIEAQKTDDPII